VKLPCNLIMLLEKYKGIRLPDWRLLGIIAASTLLG
jgi:hypothetical protein